MGNLKCPAWQVYLRCTNIRCHPITGGRGCFENTRSARKKNGTKLFSSTLFVVPSSVLDDCEATLYNNNTTANPKWRGTPLT